MRKVIRLAARLYPASWRKRYGAEYDALLEDIGPGWRDLFSVLKGAMAMRMRTVTFVAAAFGIAGALVGGWLSVKTGRTYLSSAVLRVPGISDGVEFRALVNRRVQSALRRQTLAGIITAEHLYEHERERRPLEDIVDRMRHAIRITPVGPITDYSAFTVEFGYQDGTKAQQTMRRLVSLISEPGGDSGSAKTLEILDPPSLPVRPASPNRLAVVGSSLVSGLLMASIVAWLSTRTRKIV